VELCPESAAKSQQLMTQNGQQYVGWYHSHPFFRVDPSEVDVQNHQNVQTCFDSEKKPFLGVICGPYYNTRSYESLLRIFHNKKNTPY